MNTCMGKKVIYGSRMIALLGTLLVAVICISTFSSAYAAGPYDSLINSTYATVRSWYGKSFSGMCGLFVRYELEAVGVQHVPTGALGNGNQVYGNLTANAVTSTGYRQVKFPGNNCLYDIVNTYGSHVENIVVSWTHQYNYSDANPGAGHVVFIFGIIDGVVYYNESYTTSNGVQEGAPNQKTLSAFMAAYNNSYGAAIGAVLFTQANPNPSDNLKFSDVVYPVTYKIDTTNGWWLQGGTLESNYTLTTLKSEILNSGGSVISSYTHSISGYHYSVNNMDNGASENGVKFSKINSPGSYIWRLTATDSSGRTLTMDMPFTAVSNGTTSTASMSKPYPTRVELDLNGWLDGAASGNLGSYGTCDVYINGTRVGDDITDYYTSHDIGTTYEFKDIKAMAGYVYTGIKEGSLSGTLGTTRVNVALSFNTVSVTLNSNSLTLVRGSSATLSATVSPANANQDVIWTSSNPAIAEVSAAGVISAISQGAVTITATTADGARSAICAVQVENPPVTITLNSTSLLMYRMDESSLTATIETEDGTTPELIWSCSPSNLIMTSTNDGMSADIVGHEIGDYIVTCATKDGSASASCTIRVLARPFTSIVLDEHELDLSVDSRETLTVKSSPSDNDDKLIWESSDIEIVDVAQNGTIHAMVAGTATITCRSRLDPTIRDTCMVVVTIPVNSVTLNRTICDFSSNSEEDIELYATIIPQDATNQTLTWSSSNTQVARVRNGVVTPLLPGYARITCASSDGPKSVCDVLVHADHVMQMPEGLKTIEEEAFYDSAVQEVILQKGVIEIGSRAFAKCSDLALLYIPSSVNSIAPDAFNGSRRVVLVCDEIGYVTDFADQAGIPWVAGVMPREVIIESLDDELVIGDQTLIFSQVMPVDAAQRLHWTILEGESLATIEPVDDGAACILTAHAVGHVVVSGTTINGVTSTIAFELSEHPITYDIWLDATDGDLATEETWFKGRYGEPIGLMPLPSRDYYQFTGWYTEADGGQKVTESTVYSDYDIDSITLYAHWTENPWSEWLEASELPEGNILTESKTQYRYSDMYYSDWNYGGWTTERQSITNAELQKEESATLYGWYYYSCPNCGAHWPRYDGNNYSCNPTYGGCGSTANRQAGEVFFWDPTPHSNYTVVNHGGASRYCTSNDAHTRWYGWYDGGYKTCTGYRYATRTQNWNAWSGWSDTVVVSSTTRKVETRTVYHYKAK